MPEQFFCLRYFSIPAAPELSSGCGKKGYMINLINCKKRIMEGTESKDMKIHFAPMEGITGHVFRRAYSRHFSGISEYYSPFLTPNQTRKLTSREMEDVRPENNQGIRLIPQILTNQAEDFLWAARKLNEMGYDTVNLNLGCPSATVVPKRRGAGFLGIPEELDRFFERVSRELETYSMGLSVKTRIGMEEPEEFCTLLSIYNRYPLKKLIIHPRLQTDYYKNHPNLEVFASAVTSSENPVCYNGDIFSVEDAERFQKRFPGVGEIMLGRGLLSNPFLAEALTQKGEDLPQALGNVPGSRACRQRLAAFHGELLEGYGRVMSGDRNVLFKMKELWAYRGFLFEGEEKLLKKIKKAQKMADYQAVTEELIWNGAMKEHPSFGGWK